MNITNITVKNYRCFENIDISLNDSLNVFVGMNNAGKSSILLAVEKALTYLKTNENNFTLDDYRWGHAGIGANTQVEFSLSLTIEERKVICRQIFHEMKDHVDWERFIDRILPIFEVFTIKTDLGKFEVNIGNLFLKDGILAVYPYDDRKEESSINNLFRQLVVGTLNRSVKEIIETHHWSAKFDIQKAILSALYPKYYSFSEFRSRPNIGVNQPNMSSFNGTQTANVLLNLKNHTFLRYRKQYQVICHEFHNFYNNINIDAVETDPGTGNADIQLIVKGTDFPIPIGNVGAGMVEVLTFITNMISCENSILVIEEPECHLHPHAKKRLYKLILQASEKNQVFVITHDPLFIPWDNPSALYRFAYSDSGTTIHSLKDKIEIKLMDKIKSALNDISKRELLFARALLLVEDESQYQFLLGCAARSNIDIDGAGLSIIHVDGKDNFKPYTKMAEKFGIDFICLEDLKRESASRHDDFRRRSFGCEIEDYLRKHDLNSLMEEAEKEVGRSKQRVMRYCGEHISKEEIPEFFSKLLNDAINLCDQSSTNE